MNTKILYNICIAVLLFSASNVLAIEGSASESTKVRVDVVESSIGISVPDLIVFEDISSGYITERQDLDINNIGTVDISVTPMLENDTTDVFTNLAFRNVLADDLLKIGDFSVDILKATTVGSVRTERIYMYLDLTEVSNIIIGDDIEADVVFWAVPL